MALTRPPLRIRAPPSRATRRVGAGTDGTESPGRFRATRRGGNDTSPRSARDSRTRRLGVRPRAAVRVTRRTRVLRLTTVRLPRHRPQRRTRPRRRGERMAWSTSSGTAPRTDPRRPSPRRWSRAAARDERRWVRGRSRTPPRRKGSGSDSSPSPSPSSASAASSSFAARLRVRLAASAAGEGTTGPSGGRSSPPWMTPGACPSLLSRPKTQDQDAHASRLRLARSAAWSRSPAVHRQSGGGRRGERRRGPRRRRRRAGRGRTRGRGEVRDRARAHGSDGAQRALRGVDARRAVAWGSDSGSGADVVSSRGCGRD